MRPAAGTRTRKKPPLRRSRPVLSLVLFLGGVIPNFAVKSRKTELYVEDKGNAGYASWHEEIRVASEPGRCSGEEAPREG